MQQEEPINPITSSSSDSRISEAPSKRRLSPVDEPTLRMQFSNDIKEYLQKNANMTLKALLRHMNYVVDESTLRRNVNQKHTPSGKTLQGFYRFKFKEKREEILLELVPPIVRCALENYFEAYSTPKSQGDLSEEVNALIIKDKDFAEMYARTAFDSGTDLMSIKEEFGNRGLAKINEMIAKKILILNDGRVYPGTIRSTYPPEVIWSLATVMLDSVKKSESVNPRYHAGYIQFYSLGHEGLGQWVEIDNRAFREKMAVCQNPIYQGPIKAYTMTFTDFLSGESTHYIENLKDNQNEQ